MERSACALQESGSTEMNFKCANVDPDPDHIRCCPLRLRMTDMRGSFDEIAIFGVCSTEKTEKRKSGLNRVCLGTRFRFLEHYRYDSSRRFERHECAIPAAETASHSWIGSSRVDFSRDGARISEYYRHIPPCPSNLPIF